MALIDGLIRSVAKVLHRIADSFADMEADGPQRCEICGANTRAGQRFCRDHRAKRPARH
jgi:hypothetical protein